MTQQELKELAKKMGGTFEERKTEEEKELFEKNIRSFGVKFFEHSLNNDSKIVVYEYCGKYYVGNSHKEELYHKSENPEPIRREKWMAARDLKEITEEDINTLWGLDSNEIKIEVDRARKIKKRENAEKNIEERDNVNIPYDKALMIYSEGSEENRSRRKRIYELNGRYFIEEAEWEFLGGPGPDGRPCIWIWN